MVSVESLNDAREALLKLVSGDRMVNPNRIMSLLRLARESVGHLPMPQEAPKMLYATISKMTNKIYDVVDHILRAENYVNRRMWEAALREVDEAIKNLTTVMVVFQAQAASGQVKSGWLSPLDLTDVARMCGPMAAKIYSTILRYGHDSSLTKDALIAILNPSEGELGEMDRAINCLVLRGYLKIFHTERGIKYVAVVS